VVSSWSDISGELGSVVGILDLVEDCVVEHLSEGTARLSTVGGSGESVTRFEELGVTGWVSIVLDEGHAHGEGDVNETGPGRESGRELLRHVRRIAVDKQVHSCVRSVH